MADAEFNIQGDDAMNSKWMAYGIAKIGLVAWFVWLAYSMIEKHGWENAHGAGWLLFFAFCAIPSFTSCKDEK